MNASLANINSSSPVQAQSASGKTQESSADKPFSQVLSSEIANSRHGSDKQDASAQDSSPKTDPAEAKTTDAVKAGTPQDDAAADPSQSAAAPSAETFLALALNPELSKSVMTDKEKAVSDRPATLRVDGQTGRDAKKGLPSKALRADPLDPKTAGTQKPGGALPGKANEVAFAGQLSAARQAESTKTGERETSGSPQKSSCR